MLYTRMSTAMAWIKPPIDTMTMSIAKAMKAKTAVTPPRCNRKATTSPDSAAERRLQE